MFLVKIIVYYDVLLTVWYSVAVVIIFHWYMYFVLQGVGKTSVVIRYVGGMFSKAVSPTIGASFFTYKL